MHPYATDSDERVNVPILLAALALAAAFGVSKAVNASGLQETLWWVDIPSVLGFYGLFWKVFDRWVWDRRFLRMVRLVRVPNFSGRWVGHGFSSYKDEHGRPTEYRIAITITQRWTACLVHLETQESSSDSLIGAIMIADGRPPTLSYEYRNQPRAHAPGTMHAHPGMTRLEMVDPTHLEGEYYTGRDRQNYGTLTLTKE